MISNIVIAAILSVEQIHFVGIQLVYLCRETESQPRERLAVSWSVPIKDIEIMDQTLPSVFKAPMAVNKPTGSSQKPGERALFRL